MAHLGDKRFITILQEVMNSPKSILFWNVHVTNAHVWLNNLKYFEMFLSRQAHKLIIWVTRVLLREVWATPNHVAKKTIHYFLVAWMGLRNNSYHAVDNEGLRQNHVPNFWRLSTSVGNKKDALVYHLDIVRSQNLVEASWNVVVHIENWQDILFVTVPNVGDNPCWFQLIEK